MLNGITNLAATAIDLLCNKQVTLVRQSAGAYIDGRWVKNAADTETPIDVAFFEMSADMVEDLPQELRTNQMKQLWTRIEVLAEDLTNADSQPDIIRDGTIEYEVLKVYDRDEGAYYKAIVGRIGTQTNTVEAANA